MSLRTIGLGIWLSTACVMFPAVAVAQQATGTIGGTVQDATGAVMPGVTMTLASPGVIGGNQIAVTDSRGAYQFIRLVPGTYGVRAELPGFRTAVREDIVVNADVTVRVDMTIEVGSVQETITVAGAAPLLDTTTTQNQLVMDRKTLDTIPSGNSLWAIGAMVPAVQQTKIDVGGIDSYQAATQKVHGSSPDESRYLIDGMNVGGTSGGGGGIQAYYDTLMFEEVNYQLGQSPAENAQGGVVMNMVTKTGTNTFHGTVDMTGSSENLMSRNISPELRQALLAAMPATILQVNPNLEPSNAVPWIYDAAASVSGPVVRDRLWFVLTARQQGMKQHPLGSYNPDGTLTIDDNKIENGSVNMSWQVKSGNTVKGLYNFHRKRRFHAPYYQPAALFLEDRATMVQTNQPIIAQAKWTSVLSPRMMLDLGASLMKGRDDYMPQPEIQPGEIPRLDLVTLVASVAHPRYRKAPVNNTGLYTSFSYFAGAHSAKVGYQASRRMNRQTFFSTSHAPSGLQARYRNGVPDSVLVDNSPFDSQAVALDHAWYAQDKWTPLRKLTVNLGLRLQRTTGHVPAVCQPDTIFVTGQCYGEITNVPDWLDLSPRFGMVYDLSGNGKTALKFTANRYSLGTAAGYPQRVNPVREATATRPWTDSNGDLIPQLGELGAGTGFNLGTTNRYAAEVEQPYVNEVSAEIEQQLPGDLVVSVGFFHRSIRRDIGAKNLLVPLDGYIPLQVTERVSGRQVTVYNQNPATRGLFDMVYDNYPERDTDFNGVDINFNKRMSRRWMVMGGLSLGKNTGDTYTDSSDLNNPNFTFRDGLLATDVPVSFKMSGVYQAPLAIQLSGSYLHRTGFPESTTVQVTSQTVTLTQVTQSVRVDANGTTRLPSNDVVSFRIAKVLRVGRGQITPALDIFNLTNANTVQSWVTQLGPAYHRVGGGSTGAAGSSGAILAARMFRVGLNMTF